MSDNKWASEFIHLFSNHHMAEERSALYNAQVNEKSPSGEKLIDRISDPIPVINEAPAKKLGYCYLVHVTKQPDVDTAVVKKVCEWEIPEEYNNILEYYPQSDMWGLRYTFSAAKQLA